MATIKDKGNGHYEITVSKGYSGKGKRLRFYKNVYINPNWTEKKQKQELNRLATAFELEVKDGADEPCSEKFEKIAERWLENKKKSIEVRTYGSYKDLIEGYIKDELGNFKPKQIKKATIDSFYTKLKEMGLSVNSIKHYKVVLSQIFDDCITKGYMKENPCMSIKLPKIEKHELEVLSKDDIKKLVEALDKQEIKYKLAYNLFLLTGCRREEIAGLMWKYVDLKNKEIEIAKAIIYQPGSGVIIKTPKTSSSMRRVAIDERIIELFEEYKVCQDAIKEKAGEKWQETDFVFTTRYGLPMHPSTFSHTFTKFLKKNGLPPVRLHDLRHTVASILINEGMDIVSVAHMLGHATPTTTLTIYAHFIDKANKEAMQIMSSKMIDKT